MKTYLYLVALALSIQGCIVSPTKEGNSIRLVDNQKDYNCKYVATVTGSGSMGWTTAHDAEGAMNEVRNKAASAGANAIRVVNVDSDLETSVVVAEALACEFTE